MSPLFLARVLDVAKFVSKAIFFIHRSLSRPYVRVLPERKRRVIRGAAGAHPYQSTYLPRAFP
jgi:hypothetical protein